MGGSTSVELRAFATALGLSEERPQSHTVEGIARLLRSHGPLWVLSDDLFEGNHIAHVQIVTALKGDGSVDGTTVTLADSASGAFTTETFREFARRLETSDPVAVGVGVYHY